MGPLDSRASLAIRLICPDDVHTQVSKLPTPVRRPSSHTRDALSTACSRHQAFSLPAGGPLGTDSLPAACWSCTVLVAPRPGPQPALYCPQDLRPLGKGQVSRRIPWGTALSVSLGCQVSGLPWEALGADPTSVSGLAWGWGCSLNGGTSATTNSPAPAGHRPASILAALAQAASQTLCSFFPLALHLEQRPWLHPQTGSSWEAGVLSPWGNQGTPEGGTP